MVFVAHGHLRPWLCSSHCETVDNFLKFSERREGREDIKEKEGKKGNEEITVTGQLCTDEC